MSTKERVVVMGHKITDVDALGAAIGIYRAGKTLGKPVHIVEMIRLLYQTSGWQVT